MTEEEGLRKRKLPDATGGTEQADRDGEEWKKLTGLTLPRHGKIVRGRKGTGDCNTFVSSHGRIKRVHVNTKDVIWTTGSPDKAGYTQVSLLVKSETRQNASKRRCYIHQLVYLAFHHVEGEEWPEHVRHLDGDNTNNRRENIAGGTRSDNAQDSIRHGTFTGHGSRVKRVKQIDKTTGDVIATHDSGYAAVRAVDGGHQGGISACCLGKRKTHAGFRWEFD